MIFIIIVLILAGIIAFFAKEAFDSDTGKTEEYIGSIIGWVLAVISAVLFTLGFMTLFVKFAVAI